MQTPAPNYLSGPKEDGRKKDTPPPGGWPFVLLQDLPPPEPRNVDYLYRMGGVISVGSFTRLLSLLIGIVQEVFGILDK